MQDVFGKAKVQIEEEIEKVLTTLVSDGTYDDIGEVSIDIEEPREKNNGDFSCNIAMKIVKLVKKAPAQIANDIIERFNKEGTYVKEIQCAGPGFINFYLSDDIRFDNLKDVIEKKEDFGKSDIGKGTRVLVEFVSANPTGLLHMGNARGGALGDGIAAVLSATGYNVEREFYVNDAGNQIERFGESLAARYIQQIKGENAIEFPEDGYHGEDIIDRAKEFIEINGDKYIDGDVQEMKDALVAFSLEKNLASIKKTLEEYRIKYDTWFSEKQMYTDGEIDNTVKFFEDNGLTYEKDGAIWFKATEFGNEKDEVLIRANGLPTYLTGDIAYHRNKFVTRKFDRVINLLGADHHGHVARMEASLRAMDIDPDKMDMVIFQLVKLMRNGEVVRMSKRTGKAISLSDLLEEIGVDAARFFFNTKSAGVHLDFDLELAVKKSNENPVFYIQYAHARINSIIALMKEEGMEIPNENDVDLTLLKDNTEKELMDILMKLPEEVRISAKTLEPSRLTRYAYDVASAFHSFYNACRIKGESEEIQKARLLLCYATMIVIKNTLDLLKISAPEKM